MDLKNLEGKKKKNGAIVSGEGPEVCDRSIDGADDDILPCVLSRPLPCSLTFSKLEIKKECDIYSRKEKEEERD